MRATCRHWRLAASEAVASVQPAALSLATVDSAAVFAAIKHLDLSRIEADIEPAIVQQLPDMFPQLTYLRIHSSW